MQLVQTKSATAQIKIAKQRLQVGADRLDQSVINCDRYIVGKERSLERRWIMSCARVENIRLHRIRQCRGERVLMITKLRVELMEGAFAQFMIALHQE